MQMQITKSQNHKGGAIEKERKSHLFLKRKS